LAGRISLRGVCGRQACPGGDQGSAIDRVPHHSFVVSSGSKSLFVVGDLMHHVILIEKPRMEVAFDTDPKQGVTTRIKAMDMLASGRMAALVYHMPWPGIGHFAKQGDGFRYVAEPMQLVL